MGFNKKYYFYLLGIVGVYLMVTLNEPRDFSWNPSYKPADKNPFGGYALNQLLPEYAKPYPVTLHNETLYESDSTGAIDNILVIAPEINLGASDVRRLLRLVDKGAVALLSGSRFRTQLLDTMGLEMRLSFAYSLEEDSTYITTKQFAYPISVNNQGCTFRISDNVMVDTLATVDDLPVTIAIHHGKGKLILNGSPQVFSNVYIVGGTDFYAEELLAQLSPGSLHWFDLYSMGRTESESPLRFVLSETALKFGYFVGISTLLIFAIMEMRRRQRAIPVVQPPANTTLEFVGALSNLYFRNPDNHTIAAKKAMFYHEILRSEHNIRLSPSNPEYHAEVARKLGISVEESKHIESLASNNNLSNQELIELDRLIDITLSKKNK